jgi:dihydroflavonol-4-reductase
MVLITGGTGFLGAYIIKHLITAGYRVRALRRRNSPLPFFIDPAILNQVEWVEGDVLDVVSLQDAMEDIDIVVHAAGLVSFSPDKKKAVFEVNTLGTANVVNVALEMKVRRLIHISSVAALGRTQIGERITEDKIWDGSKINSAYAVSKYKAEMEVWRGIAEGLEGVVLNPSIIIGFGNWNHSSCAIFKTIYKGFPWYTQGINGFVYVEDTARAAVALMASDISGERFIVNGDNWSYQQVLNAIADGLGKKRPSRLLTPFLAALAVSVEKFRSFFTGKQALITRETTRTAQHVSYYSSDKLLSSLPDFHFTPLPEAIRTASVQYLENIKE